MMKKFILFGFALLSAIGAQAADTTYPESITYNNVNYALTHTEEDDVIQGYSIQITSANVNAENATENGTIAMTTTANATRTNTYHFNAMAMSVEGGTSVVYNLELNNFVASENLPTNSELHNGSYALGNGGYPSAMTLAANNNSNIFDFESISGINKYFYTKTEWDEDAEKYITKFVSTTDSLVLKQAIPNYRQGYYYLNITDSKKRNFYLLNSISVSEVTNYTTTNQYNCQVTEIHPNFRVTSTITNVTLGSKIRTIPDSRIFSEATNLALITVSGTTNDYRFRDGILYKMGGATTKYEKEIVTATTMLTDQTLAETIDSIYTDAFKNAPNGVVITSTNYSLKVHLNDNDQFKVVFLIPDEHATITEDPQGHGGYIVTGNLTQYHINNLQIKGTYMDFTSARLLTDIYFYNKDNTSNTLLYFSDNTEKEVNGDKNIIIGNQCEYCEINDTGNERFYCPSSFTALYLTYNRTFDCMWKTTALPFSLDDNQANDRIIAGKLVGYDESTNTFNFQYSSTITANYPYIIKTKYDMMTTTYKNINNALVESTDLAQEKTFGNVSFVPVFQRDTLYSSRNEYENYYGIQNVYNDETKNYSNYLQIFDGVRINPFRAYLIGPKITTGAANYRLVDAMGQLIEEGEFPITSGIESAKEDETSKAIYNLNGQKVNNARRGLNIVNGKVVLNK
jgi:hypothetical protein